MPYLKVAKCQPKTVIASVAPLKPTADGSVAPESSSDGESVTIFYQRYGHGPTKVLLIIGFAGTHKDWVSQIEGLAGTDKPWRVEEDEAVSGRGGERGGGGGSGGGDGDGGDGTGTSWNSAAPDAIVNNEAKAGEKETGIEVCSFDNRGVGRSSIPTLRADYTTTKMAEDALALLDHLGWEKAHVCGHSMGGMIACKLAVMVPHRVASLTLVGVTGGGYQSLPRANRASISLGARMVLAKTLEERSTVDLDWHFTKDYLATPVGDKTMRDILFKEYCENLENVGLQSKYGEQGHMSACWQHSLSKYDLDTIRSAGIIVAIIHGRADLIAKVQHARNLARLLRPVSRMIEFSGSHVVHRSDFKEVNGVLLGVIKAVKMHVKCTDFKASDVGLYESRGGEYWQGQAVRDEDREHHHGVADSVLTTFWRKVLPDMMQFLHIYPFLNWISRIFGLDKLWEKVTLAVHH